jgi:hypothetical protein
MYFNIDAVPAGKSLFTVAHTTCPVDTPVADRYFDEIDVVAPTRAAVDHLLTETKDEVGDGRVIGVINQSDGFVVIESWEGVAPVAQT